MAGGTAGIHHTGRASLERIPATDDERCSASTESAVKR
jgi:hypothetical protein